MPPIKLRALVALSTLFASASVCAQVVPITGGVPPVQNFDTLASSAGSHPASTLPTGWFMHESSGNTEYTVDNGTLNSGTTYSYGATASAERALGGLRSGSNTPTFGARLQNNTGAALNGLSVTYTGEQWRTGARTEIDRLDFEYSLDASSISDSGATWIGVDELDFVAPVADGAVNAAVDGNATANRTTLSAVVAGIVAANGATVHVRWTDLSVASNDDGLAIDDVSFGVPGDFPPAVASSVPADGAIDVAVDVVIELDFSEGVAVDDAGIALLCDAASQGVLLGGSGNSYTLTPAADLPHGAACTLTIAANAVTDLDGDVDPMDADFVLDFDTVEDLMPDVLSSVPADGTSGVAAGANLQLTFSEAVTVGANWFEIACALSGTRQVSDTVVSGGPVAFGINPNVDFAFEETCTVTIESTQVSDLDGTPDPMAADHAFSFSIQSEPVDEPPTVSSTFPGDGATNFARGANLSVVFSEAVTAPASAFAIACPTVALPFQLSSTDQIVFTLNPDADLPADTGCSLSIDRLQISDLDGVADLLDQNVVVSFTTGADSEDYYASVDASSCTTLRTTLHAVIDDHTVHPYTGAPTDVWRMIEAGDQDPNDTGRVLDVYFNKSFVKVTDRDNGTNVPQGSRYNREHTWPQSYGFSSTNGDLGFPNAPRSDGHMIYTSEKDWNGDRGNKPFANCPPPGCSSRHTLIHPVTGGAGSAAACDYALGNCSWVGGPDGNGGSFEVWTPRKGDVARAVLYMDIRYEGGQATGGNTAGQSEPDLVLTDTRSQIQITSASTAFMGLKSTLLAWHALDPPDTNEHLRNDAIFSFQGNRNPFIDHPEWAECLFNCNCTPPDVSANDDSYAPTEDTTFTRNAANGVLANDTDAQSDLLSATLLSPPSHGGLTLASDGSFEYVPAADYCGADSFTYRATDPSNNQDSATVTLDIACVNDAPVASDAIFSLPENSATSTVVGQVIASDPDAGTVLGYGITAGNGSGAFAISGSGQITVANSTPLNFEVTPQFVLTVTVSDAALPTPGTDTATITINLGNVEEGPAIANDDDVGTIEDAINASIPVLLNDTPDPDSGLLVLVGVGTPLHGTASIDAGNVIYNPDADYCGADSVSYTVDGGDSATITIDVQCVNDAPLAIGTLTDRTAQENVAIVAFTVAGGFSDVDAGDDPSYSQTGLPAGLVLDAGSGEISGIPATGTATGSPYPIVITATDSGGLEATQSFEYVIEPGAPLEPDIFADGFED